MAKKTITAADVIAIAQAEEGYLEKKSNKDLDDKTANAGSNNYTKYARDLVKYIGSPYMQGTAWCDLFHDWCVLQACIKVCDTIDEAVSLAKEYLIGFSAYTPTSAQYYKDNDQWYDTPKVGDQIFFHNSIRICHTGIVYKVDSSKVYTIEGNTSSTAGVVANGGCVRAKSYSLKYANISGYGRPKYASSATKSNSKDSKKSIPTLASATPNLKKGSKGTQVKYLQQDLNYVMSSGLTVDSDFGSKTETALKSFQKKYGLTVDGIYGAKSKAKMKDKLV